MQKIEKSRKMANGVRIFWTEEDKDTQDFFSYEELIALKINAFDLIENPGLYLVDGNAHRIESSV